VNVSYSVWSFSSSQARVFSRTRLQLSIAHPLSAPQPCPYSYLVCARVSFLAHLLLAQARLLRSSLCCFHVFIYDGLHYGTLAQGTSGLYSRPCAHGGLSSASKCMRLLPLWSRVGVSPGTAAQLFEPSWAGSVSSSMSLAVGLCCWCAPFCPHDRRPWASPFARESQGGGPGRNSC